MTIAPAPPTTPGEETPAAAPRTTQQLTQMVNAYHVPMTQQTIDSVADANGIVEPVKAQAFEQYVKEQAAGLYPTLAQQIMAGIPTETLLEPYRQIAKQKLGDQYEPDFQSDPKDIAALTGGFNPQTGRPAPMSLDQWKTHIMSTPDFGWDKTPQAHAMINDAMAKLKVGLGAGTG